MTAPKKFVPSSDLSRPVLDKIAKYLEWLRAYHAHEVHGIENLPDTGPVLLAVNHSFATYDIMLLAHAVYVERGRILRALMDRWFFKVDIIGKALSAFGAQEGNRETAREMLEKGEIVCVAPGGMREAIRPSSERYQIIWAKRKGFATIAILTGSPVILAACPKADDIFEIYSTNPISNFLYNNFKVPFAVLRGFGLTPLPRPVKLDHFLSKPIVPPKPSDDERAFRKQVDQFHKKLVDEMHTLMGEAVAYRKDHGYS